MVSCETQNVPPPSYKRVALARHLIIALLLFDDGMSFRHARSPVNERRISSREPKGLVVRCVERREFGGFRVVLMRQPVLIAVGAFST
jgi:hypothetical protein